MSFRPLPKAWQCWVGVSFPARSRLPIAMRPVIPQTLLFPSRFLSSFPPKIGHEGQPDMTHCAAPSERDGSKDIGDAEWRKKLSPQQFHVLREKGTDPRFGKYDDVFESGEYLCAACGALLYTSAMKFRCGCGWPGFWDCVPKAVREEPDVDGRRTEILCNACNGHLGHVFRGEGFGNPPPNERHCVNNTSVQFVPNATPSK